MAYKSPEEVKQQHLEAMGSTLGPLYHALYIDVMLLHATWQQNLKLFGEQTRVDVLNSVAGFFFWTIQRVFGRDVLLGLARLVDPPTSLKRADWANLTLQALPVAIPDSTLALKTRARVEEARTRCDFAVQWRNLNIAHHDLDVALDSPIARRLPDARRVDVEAALTSVRKTLEPIHSHYLHGMDPGFERFDGGADADALLYYLRHERSADGETGARE